MRAEHEAEFREFVTGRTERLRVFAYLCCGDWHRAEDAVQTALIRLYGAWNRARKISVDPYVRRIIVNVLIDEHRLSWFRRVNIGGDEAGPARATAVDGQRTDQRLMLTEALQHLPRRQRAAVVLRFWEDLPVEQTAQIMGCSTGAVKNLTMRGLATLRGLLTDSVLDDIQGATS
ncbi:SigE family RNA polymerase sigma factor [Phytomonospora endophytica]|uniref:RNA polymerase sigma-70 factor (Sigma-E family) n=1 Tax=Phytomonospora endophytica TaxID=714109 RepID=A0A841FKH0_9ACTN|nr:SigE family RNA polymerase sigma factor [Phytomonospora endophytica]MBB6036364.1 RNA polymerase sigma-70 factor (sigma-E family) [Phytomonospora endophytica]GIG67270.1 RNA polymerase sigma24 factor [Phytomonospora endophytica]